MLTKITVETALNAELDDHLDYSKHETSDSSNSRNGFVGKALQTDDDQFGIDTPRDREGSFEPQLIKKRQRRFTSMDDKILILYAQGMSNREIVAIFKEMYDADVSATLLSEVTDAFLEQVIEWQSRSLDPVYPIVYLDCIVVKIRQDKQMINKAYPDTQVQLCVVHMVRNSLKYVTWKDYKAVTADLKQLYQSATEGEALLALDRFCDRRDDKYPQISKSWRTHWEHLNTLFNYTQEIQKAIYTTNAIESLNTVIRKAIKKRKLFPTDDSAKKVIYLAIQAASKKWTMPIRN